MASTRGPSRRPRFEKPPAVPRKRMLAQGRKAHFMADLRSVLETTRLVPEHHRPFAETLFQRGARESTQAAHAFVREKVVADVFTASEAKKIARLLDAYSFSR